MLGQAPESDVAQYDEFRRLCRLLADQGIRSENYNSMNTATWHYALFKDAVDNQEISDAAQALERYKIALKNIVQEITAQGEMSNTVEPIIQQLQTLSEQVSTAFTEFSKPSAKLK